MPLGQPWRALRPRGQSDQSENRVVQTPVRASTEMMTTDDDGEDDEDEDDDTAPATAG